MPKAPKGAGVDKYPGLKEFATRVYRQTPAAQHESLRLQLNYFVNQAKLTGEATKMSWTSQTLQSLAARFGTPGGSTLNQASPSASPARTSSRIAATTQASAPSASSGSTNTPNQDKTHLQKGTQSPSIETKKGPVRPKKFQETNPLRASRSAAKPKAASQGVSTLTSSSMSPAPGSNASISGQNMSAEPKGPASAPKSLHADAMPVSTEQASELKRPARQSSTSVQSSAPRGSKPRASAGVAERRRARFEAPAATESPYMELHTGGPIVGTNQKLEKSYFRLTGQVNTSVVRPPDVIRRALDYVYAKYEQDRANYSYISDQFKSLRQDLTVQHIVSSLTVRVYEYNARVALEHDDLGEYNQCSAQLHDLYAQARELHNKKEARQMLQNEKEFQAYVIYYKIYVGAWEELGVLLRELDADTNANANASTNANAGTNAQGNSQGAGEPSAPSLMLARALRCVSIVTRRQNAALFACWRESTLLERTLIGKFAVREQLRTLDAMARATAQQNQALPLEFLKRGLGLSGVDEMRAFLDTWRVPHDGTFIRSVDALPMISQAVSSVSGPADIKGQI